MGELYNLEFLFNRVEIHSIQDDISIGETKASLVENQRNSWITKVNFVKCRICNAALKVPIGGKFNVWVMVLQNKWMNRVHDDDYRNAIDKDGVQMKKRATRNAFKLSCVKCSLWSTFLVTLFEVGRKHVEVLET